MESIRVSAELSNLAAIRRFVGETTTGLTADRDAIDDTLAAVDEAVSNIIIHGYHGQPGSIEVEVEKEQETLVIRLRDQSPLFDPTLVPPPDLTLPLKERRLGGLGVHLIRCFTDSMAYRVTPEGDNELTLMKKTRVRQERIGKPSEEKRTNEYQSQSGTG